MGIKRWLTMGKYKLDKLIHNDFFKKVVVIVIVCLFLFIFKKMINVLLLTLIFVLLTSRATNLIKKKTNISPSQSVMVIYLILIVALYFLFSHFFYEISNQTTKIVDIINNFYRNPPNNRPILREIATLLNNFDLQRELQSLGNVIVSYVSDVGTVGVSLLVSFLLSFFFFVESDRVKAFSNAFLTSKFGWFWKEVAYLGKKFISTFGIVLETQFIIAFVNTIITTIVLYILGFPQIPTLAVMVFILGLIPVAGVIISCIPLTFIAYAIGGVQMIIWILVLIVIIHALETYFLNPKLMSSRTKLPIFYVFLILFISEQILGIWGLIVGIPTFIFFLDVLEVKFYDKPKRKYLRRKADDVDKDSNLQINDEA